ncbi:unnamed protein product [Candida verbasci]|uniref:tRNA (adenine(58)-N(1))-methyltransferase non-catalytic subunit TRM6 n=1 Tax=Candida verbasci TaxID=1227364 RepID=A0A9W4TT98_9ASCO|nr:unnamed protein product [Candida verbasci]
MTDNIEIGQYVLIRLPSEGVRIFKLQENGRIGLGKFGSFDVSSILGFPLGTAFEIINDHKVKPIHSISELNIDEETDTNIQKQELTKFFSSSAENNQNIIDIGSKIQALTNEDIEELKTSGATSNIGQVIIEKMIAGHEGFDKKTIFSQQKYLKRKQQKFLRRFIVEYLGSSQLLESFLEKDHSKTFDLSIETLGLMMSYGNVKPGGRYLVVDETGGILTYALLERMGYEGTIVFVHENEHANLAALKYCNRSNEIDNIVKPINWLQFAEPENEREKWEDKTEEEVRKLKHPESYHRRRERVLKTNEVIDLIEEANFDGFFAISTLYLPEIFELIIPKIGGSRPIVIYNQFKENLMEIQSLLNKDNRVLAPMLIETRARPYQTIPGRMHPVMTMKSGGGYVFYGTRVFPSESIQAVGKGVKRRRVNNETASPEGTPELKKEKEEKIESTPEVIMES